MQKLKRGDKVIVQFEGIVVNSPKKQYGELTDAECSVRISVRPRPGKYSWWSVVPRSAVKKKDENDQHE